MLRLLALGSLVLSLAATLPVAPAATAAEPRGFAHFHTYAEIKAELDAAAAAHPDIASVFSIGKSFEGRDIWAIKISDNVTLDESEPEVLFDAQIHALERPSSETAMYLVDQLVSGYDVDSQIKAIVDSREIFIVPMANPDGAEFDISGGRFHFWRKNRQPNIDGTIGTDLNRNWAFGWGCCGGSSAKPKSRRFRGTAPFSAPEAAALRDFILSRVAHGRQQITLSVSFHSAGSKVLWPFGYTKADVPSTMDYDDWRAFVALGTAAAALNGYRPMQSSDMYILDGTKGDWMYGNQGIFAFTFELTKGAKMRHYPTAAELAADEARNRPALLYLLEQADCPYRAARLEAEHCVAP